MLDPRQNRDGTAFRCIRCGGDVETGVLELGSTRCLDCRSGNERPVSAVELSPASAPDDLVRELERSRRFSRPLALIGAPAESRYGAISGAIRKIDRIWLDDGAVYVLLPESDRCVADALLDRLHRSGVLPSDAAVVAVFPDDALTSRALLDAARPPKPNSHARADQSAAYRGLARSLLGLVRRDALTPEAVPAPTLD